MAMNRTPLIRYVARSLTLAVLRSIVPLILLVAPTAFGAEPAGDAVGAIVWDFENMPTVGGHKVTPVGNPRIVKTEWGPVIEFDGVDDGIFIDANPLAGLAQFTVEVVFRPASGGAKEQRFLHFQPDGSEDRVLFETRLPGEGKWFLDTYLQTGPGKHTLFADKHLHPLDQWQHAAIVVDGRTMRHFVNGQEELSAEVQLIPLAAGKTSLGMRFNQVHWFKGQVRKIRVTPTVLKPAAFLKP